ncbi:DUF6528 family protein [Photorhabdus akhurstii]|uniref:DUF6528 family protein n=1 Tax=Photorhabdus akhurstii TaxID=171438 RepID=UPI001BD42744|nr:DUF6528 family protein [Photorhabdus akhurstii]MBS9426793.1 hypothetical protein [Photorhabdus akhurstii]
MDNMSLLVGNRKKNKIQIYKLNICGEKLTLTDKDVVWESPNVQYMTEIKPILYNGKKSILSTTSNGVIIFELSKEKRVLFHKEITGYQTNIHSAHSLPDGNVVIADSYGWLGILPAGGNNVEIPQEQVPWYKLAHAHALSYDENAHKLYAGGYTTIKKYTYQVKDKKPVLTEEASYDISDYYLRCKVYNKCSENADWEDGVHDMYQVYGEKSGMYFLSTGERCFLFDSTKLDNVPSGKITLDEFKPFYEIDSKISQGLEKTAKEKKVILKKGGIKAVSGFIDQENFLTIAHAAPWFTTDDNYFHEGTHLIFSTKVDDIIDFDITDKNKINFSPSSTVSFYKARLLDKNWMPDL